MRLTAEFLLGALSAFIISVVVWKFRAILDALAGARRWLRRDSNGRKAKATEERAKPAYIAPHAPSPTKKPFEFRKRLWHEPPELDYEEVYGHYDAVQKKLKELGGPDLEWRTAWLDLRQEQQLLFDYHSWSERQRRSIERKEIIPATGNDIDFYKELSLDLLTEMRDVEQDEATNDFRFGKTEKDKARFIKIYISIVHKIKPETVQLESQRASAKTRALDSYVNELMYSSRAEWEAKFASQLKDAGGQEVADST